MGSVLCARSGGFMPPVPSGADRSWHGISAVIGHGRDARATSALAAGCGAV